MRIIGIYIVALAIIYTILSYITDGWVKWLLILIVVILAIVNLIFVKLKTFKNHE